jgi:hypothetical protein
LLSGGPLDALSDWVVGAMPSVVCRWIFDMLGSATGDMLDDLLSGSGAVGGARAAFSQLGAAWAMVMSRTSFQVRVYVSCEALRDALSLAVDEGWPPVALVLITIIGPSACGRSVPCLGSLPYHRWR